MKSVLIQFELLDRKLIIFIVTSVYKGVIGENGMLLKPLSKFKTLNLLFNYYLLHLDTNIYSSILIRGKKFLHHMKQPLQHSISIVVISKTTVNLSMLSITKYKYLDAINK